MPKKHIFTVKPWFTLSIRRGWQIRFWISDESWLDMVSNNKEKNIIYTEKKLEVYKKKLFLLEQHLNKKYRSLMIEGANQKNLLSYTCILTYLPHEWVDWIYFPQLCVVLPLPACPTNIRKLLSKLISDRRKCPS